MPSLIHKRKKISKKTCSEIFIDLPIDSQSSPGNSISNEFLKSKCRVFPGPEEEDSEVRLGPFTFIRTFQKWVLWPGL